MSSDYFDMVLCKVGVSDRAILFRAPAFTHLSKGDRVIVETRTGTNGAVVMGVHSVDKNDKDEIDFIITACGQGGQEPLRRVLSKCLFHELQYDDDDEIKDEEDKEDE